MFNRRSGWILIVILLLGGCASPPPQEDEKPVQRLWPEPPDRPRFIHEATLRTSSDISPPSEDEIIQSRLSGQSLAGRRLMLKPHAIAARGGRLYVTDTQMNVVHVFDLPRRRHFHIGYRFEGKLLDPRGVAVDDAGKIYVVDTGSDPKRIVVYDSYGLFIRGIPLDSDVTRPTGIAVAGDGSSIYLVDTGGVESDQHRVLVYDPQGKIAATIGTRGSKPGTFNLPVDVAVSRDGRIYVLDSGNFRMQAFDNHEPVKSWGKVGRMPGDFSRPRAIASDDAGNVYVSDAQFSNVQIFDRDGRLLMALGERGGKDKNGLLSLVAGIEVDEKGYLYVLDQQFAKIEVYRRLGEQEALELQRQYQPKDAPKP